MAAFGVQYRTPPPAPREFIDRTEEYVAQLLLELQPYAAMVIDQARSKGINAVVIEAYRAPARQRALYAQGRTKPGPIVTDTLISYHSYGRAFDVAIVRDGVLDYTPTADWQLGIVGRLAKQIGWRWGGDWKLRDLGHLEY